MKKLLFLWSLFLYSSVAPAQQVRPDDAVSLYGKIAQLQHLTRVLYLAAHPDDENTRLLGWLVNHEYIPTAYLSLTRGDGGQNILGPELGPALGLIRTHELLEARKMDGAEQFFSRAVDFGFSKNYTETFKHWNRDSLIKDIVWIIRRYRPDVVICRFPPNELAGHGHHAASAILAKDAFLAAGSPERYPEQQSFYKTWTPKRLVWNTFQFGNRNTTSEEQFKIEVGDYSPLLGMGYGELAGKSRSIHKSQGAGTPSVAGKATEYFQHTAGDTARYSLFDGIDISWNRIGRPDIGEAIAGIMDGYDFRRPEQSLPLLLQLRSRILTVKDTFWRMEKVKALDAILLSAAGFMAEAVSTQREATPGEQLAFTLQVIARPGKIPVYIREIRWPDGKTSSPAEKLKKDTLFRLPAAVTIPESTPYTQPYWLASPGTDEAHYVVPDLLTAGLPEAENQLSVSLSIALDTHRLTVPVPLSWKILDPVKGDVIEPLLVIPPLSLDFSSPVTFIKADGSLQTALQVRAERDIPGASVELRLGTFRKTLEGLSFRKGLDTLIPVHLKAEEIRTVKEKDRFLTATVQAGNQAYNHKRHLIRYDHLPTLTYFTTAKTAVLFRNWNSTVGRIGYIKGAGDQTAEILREAGFQVDMLTADQLGDPEKLKKYEAILGGIRLLNTEKEMLYRMPLLLDYVKNGGTLIMQYNNYRQMLTEQAGPYPFHISGKRVTEEDAEVRFLLPQHRLLNHPNKITAADFADWTQERGLYFPDTWDDQYEALLQMSDEGEDPLDGALLYARYGKGHYIYTGLSFFRQLPAGNPGAFRILMNMLSSGK